MTEMEVPQLVGLHATYHSDIQQRPLHANLLAIVNIISNRTVIYHLKQISQRLGW